MTEKEFIKKWGEGADHPLFDDEERERAFGSHWNANADNVFWVRSFRKYKPFISELAKDYLALGINGSSKDRALSMISVEA